MARTYNDPAGGTPSGVGGQFRTDHYQKKALIEAKKEQFFGQLSDTVSMPKNMGKKIKKFHYIPLLDDANINDQGIDTLGSSATTEVTIEIIPFAGDAGVGFRGTNRYATGTDLAAAQAVAMEIFAELGIDTTALATDTYAEVKAYVEGLTPAWIVTEHAARPVLGNLYGSSKDVGTIVGKLPALSESGGRVNRVGFKRKELEGSFEKFGFFDEYTQESLDFDTDEDLEMHVNREMVVGANEITEDALQIDLLSNAGVVRFGGAATSVATISGENADITLTDVIGYEDLMRLSIDLDNNRCPKNTKMITGTRIIDTKVVYASRYLYIGSELIPTIRRMKDLHGNPAFIPVQQYAAGGQVAVGEIGSVDQFRIIVVPEMMHWAGVGAAATTNPHGYRETGGNYDVFPMLVVGSESFVTIGFQTNGKTVKFKITHKKPGRETADRTDPYGEMGFMSIKWYYGFMLLRPERIAVCKSLAEL